MATKKTATTLNKTSPTTPTDQHHNHFISRAKRLARQGHLHQAGAIYAEILKQSPNHIQANHGLGLTYYQLSRVDLAVECLNKTTQLAPDDAVAHKHLGHALLGLGRAVEAAHCYRRAAALAPEDADARFSLGIAQYNLGQLTDAAASYRRAIALRPNYADAYRSLTLCKTFTEQGADTAAMQDIYQRAKKTSPDRMHTAYGLGKVFEDLGLYEQAFDYIAEGNRINRSMNPYNADHELSYLRELMEQFDADFFAHRQGLGRDDPCPIFIVGMPRSGTSLVEQMLANHPDIHGAGELRDMAMICLNVQKLTGTPFPGNVVTMRPGYFTDIADAYLSRLRTYAPNAHYICDKMPHNFQYIGIIATALPHAKIIHCQRDPVDTCLSLFKHYFPEGHTYGNDLQELAEYYQTYQALMEHWQQHLPEKIVSLRYENLVTNPEAEIRTVLQHCGIAFDAACLSFDTSNRAVATASAAQIRQPIFTSAIGAWKHYQTQLQPLIEQLQN